MTYSVVDVTSWATVGGEPLGSKRKVWLRDPEGKRWLFKSPRPTAGDDWAEKACAELGRAMALPCAEVELASLAGERGSITRSFVPEIARGEIDAVYTRLVHGNELLYDLDPTYPRGRRRRVAQHTVDGVLDALIQFGVRPPESMRLVPQPRFDSYFHFEGGTIERLRDGGRVLSAPEVFVGYLAFDAWIGNQDRHHENWGILAVQDVWANELPRLAPSFDHAASLGQILTDRERLARLDTRDRGYSIEAWIPKARSHLYLATSDAKPARTLDAFVHAARRYPAAARCWRDRIVSVGDGAASALDELPSDRTSAASRRFALRSLELVREALQALDLG